jgi:hypothetical protein
MAESEPARNVEMRGVVTTTPIASIHDVEWLSRLYTFTDDVPITNFLLKNPRVLSKLAEAYGHIADVWGRPIPINLELIEPYEESETESLMAYIQTADDVDDAHARLTNFTNRWWSRSWSGVTGLLNFDVENRCA